MFTMNGVVACKPPDTKVEAVKIVHGVAQHAHRSSFTALEVLYAYEEKQGSHYFAPGDVVYVLSQRVTNESWSKQPYEIGGVKFVLVPLDSISLVDSTNGKP